MVSKLDVRHARAAITMPVDQARGFVEGEAQAREQRRVMRMPRGRGGQLARCQSCNRFMARRGGECGSCGYVQGVGWPS